MSLRLIASISCLVLTLSGCKGDDPLTDTGVTVSSAVGIVRPVLVPIQGGGSQLQFIVRPEIRNDGLSEVYLALCAAQPSRTVEKLQDKWVKTIDASCETSVVSYVTLPIGALYRDSLVVAAASGVPSPVQLAAIPGFYRLTYAITKATSGGAAAAFLLPVSARTSNEFELQF